MVDLGQRAGRKVVCLLTDMDQPLGAAVGNALEVREAVATLTGEGPPDFTELVLEACSRLLALSDLGVDAVEGRELAERATTDGTARETYERWVRAQGGDPDLELLPRAPVIREVRAPRHGIVTRLAALPIGVAALELGAGRRTKGDTIDHAVGIVCSAKRGQEVEAGRVLADVHARDEDTAASAADAVLAAYEISSNPPHAHREILLDVVA
jgi:pyrimidine-nucleoside phosphorylase